MILDRKVSISRLVAVTGNSDQSTYETISGAEAVAMNIQPASAELTVLIDGQYASAFRFFTTYSGLKPGYRVTVSGSGTVYNIKGVEDWNFPPLPHYEGAMVRMEE